MGAREAFLAAAQGYVGTRFHHQGRVPGVGLDCAGVVVCAARAAGLDVQDVAGYGRIPGRGEFMAAIRAHCEPVRLAEVLPGDLMMFTYDADPQHVAVVSQVAPFVKLIHGYARARAVAETRLDDAWRNRLASCWRIRGMD